MCSLKLRLDDEKLRSPSMAALPSNPSHGDVDVDRMHSETRSGHRTTASPWEPYHKMTGPGTRTNCRRCLHHHETLRMEAWWATSAACAPQEGTALSSRTVSLSSSAPTQAGGAATAPVLASGKSGAHGNAAALQAPPWCRAAEERAPAPLPRLRRLSNIEHHELV